MKKQSVFFLLVVIIFCKTSIFAQYGIMFEGKIKCKDVINSLREGYNDSIAVDIFKKDCKIIDMPNARKDWLLEQNYITIIQYFNSDEGGVCFCRSNVVLPSDYPLLDDRKKSSSGKSK